MLRYKACKKLLSNGWETVGMLHPSVALLDRLADSMACPAFGTVFPLGLRLPGPNLARLKLQAKP